MSDLTVVDVAAHLNDAARTINTALTVEGSGDPATKAALPGLVAEAAHTLRDAFNTFTFTGDTQSVRFPDGRYLDTAQCSRL